MELDCYHPASECPIVPEQHKKFDKSFIQCLLFLPEKLKMTIALKN